MKFTQKKLKNGLRYILAPMKNTQAVTVMVLVGTGSMYETKKESGLSHFLEHMCFKGTAKRPNSTLISEELDNLGAQSNAFTGAHSTGYWAKGYKKNAVQLLDVLVDIYLHPIFPEHEIKKEKGVVIEEINMYEDDPRSKVGELIDTVLFGDQAAGRQIIGTKKTVMSFTQKDLQTYRDTHYTPENTIVVVAGAFKESDVAAHISSQFSSIKRSKKPVLQPTVEKQTSAKVEILHKTSDQTHFIISFHAYDMYDKRIPALKTLSTVLGGAMSSRLFKKMREELGICYYIGTQMGDAMNHGVFSIHAGVANDRLNEAITGIIEELQRIKEELISDEELQRVKNLRLSSLVLGLETSSSVADRCVFHELYYDKIYSVEESTKLIEGVTKEQVRNVAKDILVCKKANLAIVGPHKDKENLKKLLKW